MSKVQVDTIVDKDDVSAPTFSKGAIVTGVCTATTFVGALTGNADTATTATTASGNAGGLTGTPSITVTDVGANDVNATGIITATSFAGDGSALTGITQTTINNNANNLLITGSGTANTLEAESQLTYDGTNFQLKKTGSSDYNEIIQDANPSSENGTLGYLSGYWNTARVADIRFAAGDDTSNKDNAHICFRTTNAGSGSVTDRLRIGHLGQLGLPVGPVGTAATDWGSSGQVLTSGGASAAPSWATPSGGLSVVDQWHYAADCSTRYVSGNSLWLGEGTANSSGERSTGDFTRPSGQGLPTDGTGISNTADSSSGSDRYGWFKFPATGVYKVDLNLHVDRWGHANKTNTYRTWVSTDGGGSFTQIAEALVYLDHPESIRMLCQHTNFVNVTDTSNDIVKFTCETGEGDNDGAKMTVKKYSNATFMKVN
tara:strand:+ start:1995 stop:3284 length:1290 start_codon:yes stop_codon:yes gene_type:complete